MATQNVIDCVIQKAKTDLQVFIDECNSQKKPLCDLRIDWKDPHYEKKELQYLYMLRYFYAYLLEFKWLFNYVELDYFNVFSIGCGAYVDLLGLFTSHKSYEKNVTYCGIDPVDWEYRDFIKSTLPHNYEINFQQQRFEDYVGMPDGKNVLGRANVIIFPKSIEYMDTSAWAKIVEETDFQEKTIYLIMNAMDFDYKNDVYKIDYLAKLLETKVYNVCDNKEKSEFVPQWFCQFPESPEYPHDISDSWLFKLPSQCISYTQCTNEDCYLKKFNSPIYSTSSFQYKIVKLVKNDSQC